MAEHKDSYYYRVKGLFVPYLAPETLERDIDKYIDRIEAETEDLERSYNRGEIERFISTLENIQGMLQSVFARQCESYAVALLKTARERNLDYCDKTLRQAIADFLLLSIELQKAQKLGMAHAAKYKSVEKNEELARNMSAIGRLITSGDYGRAQSMASELRNSSNEFAKLFDMLSSRQYDRAAELAMTLEKEHVGYIRQPAEMTKSQKTVLAVDDRPEILASVSNALKSHYRVLGAPEGRVALDIIERQPIDLFFVDIDMPVMDGFELTERIRSNPKHKKTPILFLTGNASRDNIARALAMGVDEFIVKPAYDVTLLTKARKYLD